MSRRITNPEIEPDEIFSDSLNIPGFNEEQFEGRIEKPIPGHIIFFLGIIFLSIGGVFIWRVWSLQISSGAEYSQMSERNHLRNVPVFSDRGVIYDRNHVELAWNAENKDMSFSNRTYAKIDGLGHILGYVSPPKMDQSGNFWQKESIGMDGVEKFYDAKLKGKNGVRLVETDVSNKIKSESVVVQPKHGRNLTLSIDSRINEELYKNISELAHKIGFTGGAGIIMDVRNGEILSLTSYPEYNSEVLASGYDTKTIQSYIDSKRKPFLNRAVSGLYTPGSIIKPYVAVAALSEGIIDANKQILSTGSISVPNPYFPDKKSVFNDWKAHGLVDMRHAIAVSSDVYFYEIGGGYHEQKGLGIDNIDKYVRLFGLGDKTGVDLPGESVGIIPTPEWKKKNFNGDNWLLGNTYHTAIGQYGFQVTVIQAVRAVAALANNGTLVTPHVVSDAQTLSSVKIPLDSKYFQVPKEGMRLGVTEGIAQGLNVPAVAVAAKSGTAELGVYKEYVNSWITGFFPYENPKYAFAIVMERGPRENTTGSAYIMREMLDWMAKNAPEYLK